MFLLNMQSKDPIYEQIKSQIVSFIRAGVMKEGDRLPSVRELARDNGINPNTVAKAYRELEAEGVICTLPKKGAYVAGTGSARTGSGPGSRTADGAGSNEAGLWTNTATYGSGPVTDEEIDRILESLKARGAGYERIASAARRVFGKTELSRADGSSRKEGEDA